MLKKTVALTAIAGFTLLLGANSASAKHNFEEYTLKTPGTKKVLNLPEQATSSKVIHLGVSIDPQTNKAVEGYAIKYNKKDQSAKLEGRGKKPKQGGDSQCYGYLANGAKWKILESWIINPSNSDGLTEDYVLNNFSGNVYKWEEAADGVVGNGYGVDILGTGYYTYSPLSADETSPDGLNEVYFGEIADPDTIGVTIVWGIFGGRLKSRELLEWDQVYNTAYDWGNSGANDKMDFESIATHELGHSVGMGDLYTNECTEETMYGYAGYGETNKRDLGLGDIIGINKLY